MFVMCSVCSTFQSNRIAGGSFLLDGQRIQVTRNYADGKHTLHGGSASGAFHTQRFTTVSTRAHIQDDNREAGYAAVTLRHISSGDDECSSEGFPGTVTCTVKYLLTNRNELRIEMSATSDKKTVIGLCNHAYWYVIARSQ
jgi:aldose 1-epimerase